MLYCAFGGKIVPRKTMLEFYGFFMFLILPTIIKGSSIILWLLSFIFSFKGPISGDHLYMIFKVFSRYILILTIEYPWIVDV